MSSEMAPFYRPYCHIETAGILSSLQNVVISRKQCKMRGLSDSWLISSVIFRVTFTCSKLFKCDFAHRCAPIDKISTAELV